MAMRREVAERVGFDAAVFDGFHLYDLDFSFLAFLAGYRIAVCRDLVLVHESIGRYDAAWERYAGRFADKFRDRLPAAWTPRDGARAEFFAGSDAEVMARCRPEALAAVIRQIDAANASLAPPAST
jgi:hypothetical protein